MSRLQEKIYIYIRVAVICALVVCGLSGFSLTRAYADPDDVLAEPDEAQLRVEETAAAYNSAVAKVEELQASIDENNEKLSELEAQLPDRLEKGQAAMRELYKMQRDSGSLLDLIFSSQDFADFVNRLTYMQYIHGQHVNDLQQLRSLQNDLETTRSDLEAAETEAEAEQERAKDALEEAKALREEAQRRAQEQLEREAEERARAQAEADAEANQVEDDSESTVSEESSQNGSEYTTPPAQDNADWSDDKSSFVSKWAGRIDSYLAGSPLSGYGKQFASAAWDYGVDPRWSPAISCVESSKGAVCFRSHNAWGWGSSDWPDWNTAIDAHVRGLAAGYGYTLTETAAQKYCPPTWSDWYNKVATEMDKI